MKTVDVRLEVEGNNVLFGRGKIDEKQHIEWEEDLMSGPLTGMILLKDSHTTNVVKNILTQYANKFYPGYEFKIKMEIEN
jgi:hypothetical protein